MIGKNKAVRGLVMGAAVLGAAAAPALGGVGWSAPQDVLPADPVADTGQLAIDPAGTAVLVADSNTAPTEVALRQPAGAPWSAPVVLGQHGTAVTLAMTSTGPLAVWHGSILDPGSPINQSVWAASGALDGTWAPAQQVATGLTAPAGIAWLQANDIGDAVVSVGYRGGDDAAGDVILARHAGGPWAPLDLGPVAPWARIALDAKGGMLATWRDGTPDSTTGESVLRAAVRDPGAATFTEITSPLGAAKVFDHVQASSPAGDVAVLATYFHGGGTLLASVATRAPAQLFGSPTTVAPAGLALGANGTVALGGANASGRPIVSVRPPGGSFGAPVVVGTAKGEAVVGVGPDGTIVAAWNSPHAPGTGPARVWASVRPPGGAFQPAQLVADSVLPQTVHQVAVGSGGAAVITIRASMGSKWVMQAARRGPNPLITHVDAARATGGLSVHVRLGAPAKVTITLTRLSGARLVQVRRTLGAGASNTVIRTPRAQVPGRYRVQVLATATGGRAAASAPFTVPKAGRR